MIARLLFAGWLLLLGSTAAAKIGFDPLTRARIDRRLGAQVPLDTPLVDATGRPTTLRRLGAGRPILLAPVLHDCPNLCDVTLTGLARAIAGQSLRPGGDFTIVAFGIDPKEGPGAAADDLGRLGRHAPAQVVRAMQSVVGSPVAIHAVTDAIGYHYAWDPRAGQYAHAAAVAALTPDGRLSSWLYGLAPTPDDVRQAVEQARTGGSTSWAEPLLLLCFHYDPTSGRYTVAIEKLLRLAGVVTIALLALLIVRLRRTPV